MTDKKYTMHETNFSLLDTGYLNAIDNASLWAEVALREWADSIPIGYEVVAGPATSFYKNVGIIVVTGIIAKTIF